jgi:hypothetical protein
MRGGVVHELRELSSGVEVSADMAVVTITMK